MNRYLSALAVFFVVLAATPGRCAAQAAAPQPGSTDQNNPEPKASAVTIFPHPDAAPFLVSGQANIIFQAHPGFHSPYAGANSLVGRGEYKVSLVGTLYLGLQVHNFRRFNTDLIYNEESAGGRGISQALGLAGFTNLDVVRNPSLGSKPYMARAEIHQTIGLSSKMVDADRTQFSLATKVPQRRIDLRAGKLSLPDILDINGPGSDSHLQFLNWTADNNGAWDYAADTRGYTDAAIFEYDDTKWSARYALALMPTEANGITLSWHIDRARGENVEFELRSLPVHRWLPAERKGTVRLLGFVNHANMGLYRDANNAALAQRAAGQVAVVPDITAHPLVSAVKYGVGLNFEQELTSRLRTFGRFGWNEGQHQSYAYTEVDQTFELGADLKGDGWSRPGDKVGIAGISNAIKRDHQRYLALGGQGFLLGDGALSYAREDILEAYYTTHNWRGLFTSFDLQLVAHPGYNQSRGPVAVFAIRTHVDF